MYHIIVAKLSKSVDNSLTTSVNLYQFQLSQLGENGNVMCLPLDSDKGIKAYYDRTFNVQVWYSSTATGGKEIHKLVKFSLRRKGASTIVFDSTTQNIINIPLTLYVLGYDSKGSFVTDNITSYTYSMCMCYKDRCLWSRGSLSLVRTRMDQTSRKMLTY
jgi:hypothetical protein